MAGGAYFPVGVYGIAGDGGVKWLMHPGKCAEIGEMCILSLESGEKLRE